MDRNLQEQEEKYKEVKHLLEYDVINDI